MGTNRTASTEIKVEIPLGMGEDDYPPLDSDNDIQAMQKKEQRHVEGLLCVSNGDWKVIASPNRRASGSNFNLGEPLKFDVDQSSNMMMGRATNGATSKPPGLSVTPPDNDIWAKREQFYVKTREIPPKSPVLINSPQSRILSAIEFENMPRRGRSHSSSDIFGIDANRVETDDAFHSISSLWSSNTKQQNMVWDGLCASQLATRSDMNGQNAQDILNRFKQQQHQSVRRFSVAPSMVNRFITRNANDEIYDPEELAPTLSLKVPSNVNHARRHSVAGPTTLERRPSNAQSLSDGLEALGLNNGLQQIDDYFGNTESRTRAFKEAGKNLQANQTHNNLSESSFYSSAACTQHSWPLFVVEFKAGRTDYFYRPGDELAHIRISVGDLAIVEADRGKDLGKVVETGINSPEELELYQKTHQDPLVDSHNAVGKEIQPRRLYRLAQPNEVALLLQKGLDEGKAQGLCQIKIRQKALPMEIVDAEYQWDRRKLTFYFVADRRIDFRELVRELFKIYKTRIWMCAVQPVKDLDE